eukprot:COSAG06_NODE_42883_length_377_cov_1.035971_1_plen_70_part_10
MIDSHYDYQSIDQPKPASNLKERGGGGAHSNESGAAHGAWNEEGRGNLLATCHRGAKWRIPNMVLQRPAG